MKASLLAGTALQASAVLGLQLFAMTTLEPRDFGAFSLVYLASAFGQSVSLSVLLDPWLLARERESGRDEAFEAVLAWLALASLCAATGIALATSGDMLLAILGGAAAGATLLRAAWRYRCMAEQRHGRVLLGDALSLAVLVAAGVAVVWIGAAGLAATFAIWCAAALASCLPHPLPLTWRPSLVRRWFASRGAHIRRFLADSLLMDLGAIGTPYIIGGIAGLAALGVYRGVSNAAAPVRLVLTPLRPVIVRARMSRRRWVQLSLLSLGFGAAAWSVLRLLGATTIELGTLTALVPIAVPTGIFVAANCMGHAAYLIARGGARLRGLMLGRGAQTLLALALPIGGALLTGVPGAAWGLAIATSASAAAWTFIAIRSDRPRPSGVGTVSAA